MNLSAPFINRPVMTTFVMLAILIAGCLAFQKLPVSDLPTIDKPTIKVTAGYTGATPDTMVNEVTIPLEKELTHISGIQEISSKSSAGSSHITLKFDLDKNIDEAIREVQAALNRAEFAMPKDLDQRPAYYRDEGNHEPILYMLLSSDQSSIAELHNYAEAYILPRLTRIEGVSQVEMYGAGKTIWLRVNPELMAARNIGFNQIIETVKTHTSQMPLGTIQTGSRTLAIELSGKIQQAKELENLKIGNTSVKIKDIGAVSEGSLNEQELHLVTPDQVVPTLILAVKKISDGNTVAISNAIREVLPVLDDELPSSMHLDLWFDKAVWIHESIQDVELSLLLAFALVVVVIFLSLGRVSEALIPSLALPLSLVGTLAVMYLLHYSLDLLSLLALTLSVGFVVDDAIVVLENIVRHNEMGSPPKEASLRGSKQICFTILSMTISLVAVFIPLLFLGGMNGRLFREFSVTLAVAILVSGFVSLTLTPMLCSRFLSSHSKETKLQHLANVLNDAMVNIYKITLRKCFAYPKTVLLVALICMGVSVPLFKRLPVNLIPPEDRGFLIVFVNAPSGIPVEESKQYQQRIESLLQSHTYFQNFIDILDKENLIFLIKLLPHAQRPPQAAIIEELQAELDKIPGTLTFISGYQMINLEFDLSSGNTFRFMVRGMDFPDVEKGTKALKEALQTQPEISFVNTSLDSDAPKLVVNINEEQAHHLGLDKRHIQMLLMNAYGGGSVGTIQTGAQNHKIYMELMPEFQKRPDTLAKLFVTTANGTPIPLKSIADWHETLGSPSLHRVDQLPSATVSFSLAKDVPLLEGFAKVEETAKKVLPSSVSGTLRGAAKMVSSTMQDTILLLLASALVMYIVLGILYESFIHPLTILSSLPLAGLGGILTLTLFNEPLSLFSAVGFLLLLGIVKKNGIMMVDYALEAQSKGLSPQEAIFEGCLVRFRPIMMTTIAAIMGALPIALGIGDGAEIRRGLGLVIVGGLLFSQLLTLYITPIIYLTFEKMRRKKHVETAVANPT